MKSLSDTGVAQKDRVSLVVNRYLNKSDITIKEAEENINSEFFWTIPNDYRTTMSAINQGRPLYEISPRSEITRKISGLADTILYGEKKVEKKGWFFRKK
jgi:pilus assembly protein CpaE